MTPTIHHDSTSCQAVGFPSPHRHADTPTVPQTHTAPARPARPAGPRHVPPQPSLTDPTGIGDTWEEYKRTADRRLRDHLLVHYTPLVRYVASRVGTRIPHLMDEQDLVQYGFFGLADAIEKFDLSRNLKFETYAVARIRGAILDEIRASDWVPRSVRTKIRDVERATRDLEDHLGRPPTEQELADTLDVTIPHLREVLGQRIRLHVSALDEIQFPHGAGVGDPVTLGDRIADRHAEQPDSAAEESEAKAALSAAVRNLPDRERIVISLYYYENLTLGEIGQVLGVTESRICQIHTRACKILRAALDDEHPDAA